MFYQFVSPTSNVSLVEDIYFNGALHKEPYATLNYAINILLYIVSVLGIAGNTATVVIYSRIGLKKSSNMMICCLAVADALYLLGITNIPLQVYTKHPNNNGFFVSEAWAFFLYILYQCAVFLDTVGKVASLLIPVLIALERIVAVFFPLHFSRILRPDLLKALVVLLFLMGIPVYVSYCMLVKFVYRNNAVLNLTSGVMLRSDDYINSLDRYRLISEVYISLCGPVCTGIVTLACIAVGAKVHIQMKERRRLLGATRRNHQDHNPNIIKTFRQTNSISLQTNDKNEAQRPDSPVQNEHVSSETSIHKKTPRLEEIKIKNSSRKQTLPSGTSSGKSSDSSKGCVSDLPIKTRIQTTKTTKILMSVCVFYTLDGLYGFLSVYLVRTLVSDADVGLLIHRISILIMCINSGINFFIYAFFNPNFRKQYRKIFCRCRPTTN